MNSRPVVEVWKARGVKTATSESWTKVSEEFKGTLDKLAGAFKSAAATFGG